MNKKYTVAVRKRFVYLMRQVIAHRINGIGTDRAFCEVVKILPTNMSRIITGERYPTVEMICNACITLNVSPEWLITGEGEMFLSREIKAPNIPAEISKPEKRKTA